MSDNNDEDEIVVYTGEEEEDEEINGRLIRVHPSVRVIPACTFYSGPNSSGIEEVELCEGLLEIGQSAFRSCNYLKRIEIPSTVTIIHNEAFICSKGLEKIVLCEGNLVEIGDDAFKYCKSLKDVSIPSSVKIIGDGAFEGTKLSRINLHDGIESIGENAFKWTKLLNFRLPPIITVKRQMLESCESLFSIELSESTVQIEAYAFDSCSLRNVAIPINAEIVDGFPFRDLTALKHRFDNLPIHRMIYYQSYNNLTSDQLNKATIIRSNEKISDKLNPSGKQQDCLGMTPLHILACSTVQNLSLYQILIEKYPENLITEDRWGALPILYAIWGKAPNDIIQFLVESLRSLYPSYQLSWTNMVETLGRANVITEVIQNLLDLQKASFSTQQIDWNQVILQLAGRQPNDVSLSEETFRFLVKYSLTKRIGAIGMKQWRDNITRDIETTRPLQPMPNHMFLDKQVFLSNIQTKLAELEAEYNKVKEATITLELALWKKRMNDQKRSIKKIKIEESDLREQCRIRCGADIVIARIVPFLLPIQQG